MADLPRSASASTSSSATTLLRSSALSPPAAVATRVKRSPSSVRGKIDKLREKRRLRHEKHKKERESSTASTIDDGSSQQSESQYYLDSRRDSIDSNRSDGDSWNASDSDYSESLKESTTHEERPDLANSQSAPIPSSPTSDTAILGYRKKYGTLQIDQHSNTQPETSNGPAKTSSSSSLSNSGGGAFFSSMLSAAQNAASTFTSLTSSAVNKEDTSSKLSATLSDNAFHPNRPRAETEPILSHSPEFDIPAKKSVAPIGKGELILSSILESNNASTATRLTEHAILEDESPDATELPSAETPIHLVPELGIVPPSEYNGSLVRSSSRRRSVSGRPRNSSVSQPAASPISPQLQAFPKPSGFAVASRKRNREFHALFRSVPEEDHLIEDYGCALSREILLQGRLYISEQHICFNSNIFGWVTNLVISFDEVMAIEKKNTVVLFPNAIVVQTLHSRSTFASFISRDSTYELMQQIWHNEEHIGSSDSSRSGSGSDSDSDDVIADDSDDESADADAGDDDEKTLPADPNVAATSDSSANVDVGPTSHAPTQCSCADHYEKVVCDRTFPVPIGRICKLLWDDDPTWVMNFMTNELKLLELSKPTAFEPSDESGGNKTRSFNYIKPLNAPIGPKQTKCLATETLEHWNFDSYVTVVVTTATPDVPSGNVFVTKTKYCLTWAENNQTRMLITCGVEWSGKSWIKGPIEKGANEGQLQSANSLVASLEQEFQPKTPKKGKRGKKRRRNNAGKDATQNAAENTAQEPKGVLVQLWGMLPFGASSDATYVTYIMIGFVVMILFSAAWLFFRVGKDESSARWSALWDFEERKLWEWLDDRTKYTPAKAGEDNKPSNWLSRRELEEAIVLTQRRLDLLRSKVDSFE
ncbi:hypothetical protein V1512DRAFT_229950 [Lipomyces arxii]|uniref:uncharacterized protein n=1 Tax=Lipomyces arxii TaxID=56418 RepID=UPI0034CD3AC9